MSDKETGDLPAEKPTGSYWEDPVYRYLSRQHRSAVSAGDDPEVAHLDKLMQALVDQSMPNEQYWQLDAEAKADRKKQKQDRKQRQKRSPRPSADEKPTPVNVADLKKRIFNPTVSKENVIKALEALPPAARKATIAGLPPWLKRKLGQYIKGGKH